MVSGSSAVPGGPRLAGLGHAVPPAADHDALWDDFFRAYYGGDPRAERVWRGVGVRRRHGVALPPETDVSRWSTAARMRRFAADAGPLGKEAMALALDRARVAAGDLGLFVVASCTGYATPGIDITAARDLGMPDDVQRLFLGHMGCYAAVPALGAAGDFVRAHGRPAAVLSVELPSLHVQPPPRGRLRAADLEQAVSHALFGDAAAATVLTPDGTGPVLASVAARTDAASSDHMTWDVTDAGFRMGLSPRVPHVLARHVRPAVAGMLAEHGLGIRDVTGWAVHPGGPRILEVVAESLELPDEALEASYGVLRDYGNCSSATVLLVLERLATMTPDGPVAVIAFGPGLTLYAALLARAGTG